MALWGIFLMSLMLHTSCNSDKPTFLEPHLTTMAATDITRNEATLNGIVLLEGSTTMPQLSFRYGTTENMQLSTTPLTALQADENNTDGYESQVSFRLTHLTAGTTYYYMLQGSNGHTTITSNTMTLTTQSNERPSLGTASILSHGPMSVIVGYEIANNGGEDVTETGCYYAQKSSDTKQKVTLSNYDGSMGKQQVLLTHLQHNTTYQIWPYAKNRIGESIGEAINFTTTDAISLQEAGSLQTLLDDALYDYTSITIAGPMNGDDLCCLRKMMGKNTDGTTTPGKLSVINMADVDIVEGGGPYGSSRYSKAHVIGQGLFADCTSLTHVTLPTEATVLEKDAFSNCTALRQLEIPAAMASILPSSGCTALESISVSEANSRYTSKDGVLFNENGSDLIWFPMGKKGEYTLPATISTISNNAFKECSIETFILPDGIKEMGQGVFMDSKVKEVKLPNSLKVVPSGTFQGCTQLKVVRIGSMTDLISDYAFDRCPLTDIYVNATFPPVCTSHTFTTQGTSFLSTCQVHVPKGKANLYKASDGWKLFKNITTD